MPKLDNIRVCTSVGIMSFGVDFIKRLGGFCIMCVISKRDL